MACYTVAKLSDKISEILLEESKSEIDSRYFFVCEAFKNVEDTLYTQVFYPDSRKYKMNISEYKYYIKNDSTLISLFPYSKIFPVNNSPSIKLDPPENFHFQNFYIEPDSSTI